MQSDMQSDEKMAVRCLMWCVPVAASVTWSLGSLHRKDFALCYLVGALVSLFSFCSLTIIIPILFRPGAKSWVKGVLALTLFLKVPIFMLALYYMTRFAASGAAASVFGIALAPMVITLRTLVGMAHESRVGLSPLEPDLDHKSPLGTLMSTPVTALPAEGG